MAFQFKTRTRENAHEECEKEMGLLREYTRALEKENESRNEERKALQAEIERLLRHEREWKQATGGIGSGGISSGGISTGKSLLVVGEGREQTQLREQYSELKSKY
jgi:single-stranded DNA-specific DHH superfamily exonuclease